MHPLGLCNNNDEEDLYEYGWVGVVKLEQPELDPSCLTVLGKVKKNWLFNLSRFCAVPVVHITCTGYFILFYFINLPLVSYIRLHPPPLTVSSQQQ